jgi:uncharacterized integral membrane protein (TIGR00698 family)
MTTLSMTLSKTRIAPWRSYLPGVVVAAVLAWIAGALAGGLGDPLARNPLLVAMLFGLILGNSFTCPEILRPGLRFTLYFCLRGAVVLLGLRVTVPLMLELGAAPVLIAVGVLVAVFVIVWIVTRKLLKLEAELALLFAAGCAICGAAAVLAVAAIQRARGESAGVAITLITLFGTLALFLYPFGLLSGYLPGLDDDAYGIFVGASVFELAQVYGAGYAVSEMAVNTATMVKLVKVLLLIPILLGLVYFSRRKIATRVSLPWFVLGFVLVMVFNSVVTLPGPVRSVIHQVDVFLFTMVMIALGIETRVARLRAAGGAMKLVAAGLVALAVATGAGYAMVRMSLPDTTAERAGQTTPHSERLNTASRDVTGERLFHVIGCAKCHVPTLPVGERRIVVYSDLLLHDMGPTLDDKISQGEATGRDWRTMPLHGLGVRTRYLHDGRADTLRAAIVAHDGEALIIRDRFIERSAAEQEELYRFLRGL